VCLVVVWSAVVACAGFYLVKLLVGLRVPEEEEREGLDITSHGERAYDL
jgi:Amt family ammonium transporter